MRKDQSQHVALSLRQNQITLKKSAITPRQNNRAVKKRGYSSFHTWLNRERTFGLKTFVILKAYTSHSGSWGCMWNTFGLMQSFCCPCFSLKTLTWLQKGVDSCWSVNKTLREMWEDSHCDKVVLYKLKEDNVWDTEALESEWRIFYKLTAKGSRLPPESVILALQEAQP